MKEKQTDLVLQKLASGSGLYLWAILIALGGLLFFHGIFSGGFDWLDSLETTHETAIQTMIGLLGLIFFVPLFMYTTATAFLSQRIQKIEQQLREKEEKSNKAMDGD